MQTTTITNVHIAWCVDGLILDRKTISLRPYWDIDLCDILDLEALLITDERKFFIARCLLEGYEQAEIAIHLRVSTRTINREVRDLREMILVSHG